MDDPDHDPEVDGSLQAPLDDRLLVKWLESQSEETQSNIAGNKLAELLTKAAQPRHVSGNACIKLCYFIEQLKSSKSSLLRGIAFSEKTCLSLFSFYIEWNEKNQHRSMRQVVELLSSLIDKNPDQQTNTAVKSSILERSMSIITHQAAQPLVKPAFKALECFLSKRTISTQELINAYRLHRRGTSPMSATGTTEVDTAWDSLFSEVFEWMTLADISPAAGKFLVTAFRELRSISGGAPSANLTASWQRWIREGLRKQPDALENVKNYLFPPLFKLDRPGSLLFLEDLNSQGSVWDMKDHEIDAQSLLQLAAIETGKKSGLIEEPSAIKFNQKVPKKPPGTIVLQEEALSSLLVHSSDTVRSLAFSVLVSSSSSIRPFSSTALTILQSSMSILYCDSDAKFRNEVLSNTKHMIERLRGATALLVREIESLSFQLRPEHSLPPQERQMAQDALEQTTELLQRHASFVEWYIDFLLGELIPTSSYQRHITALKAISLLLRSGILKLSPGSPPERIADNSTVWPCMIDFFNPMSMRLLLDLLMDPFEDVRSSAASVLKLGSPNDFTVGELVEESQVDIDSSHPAHPNLAAAVQNASSTKLIASCEENSSHVRKGKPLGLLRDFVERAEAWSKRTGRADYADGVARSTSLLFNLLPSINEKTDFLTQLVEDLEKKLSIAEKDLTQAVVDEPVHGTFAALNFVWDSINHKEIFAVDLPEPLADTLAHWDSLQLRIVNACARIWEVVKDILCNDSPEGHLPQDLEEGDVIDTKDVLSYSFRAVHESSNLLQTILDKIRLRWEGSLSPPPPGIFSIIGDLTFLQLSTLRHRGAFSTVSLTFTKCCALTQIEPQTASSAVNRLQSWYQGALLCIHEQPSTTRRSAGIPALFTAIMAAQATVPSFERVMAELMALAGHRTKSTEADEINVYQVHALNCIKEIFKSTTLGKRSERYISQGLELAVESMRSPKWAIRNSGLILLRSTVDRIFGTSEGKTVMESGWDGKSVKLNYDAYPNMAELLDNLLKAEPHTSESLAQPAFGVVQLVLPALDIVRRAGPPQSQKESIFKSVTSHLGSPIWHIREQAAKTVCIMMLSMEWKSSVLSLLDTPTRSANLRHGVLLAVKAILERRWVLDPATALAGVLDLIPRLQRLSSDDAHKFKSPIIINGHIELSIAIAQALVSYETRDDEERAQLDQTKSKFWNIAGASSYPRMPDILQWFYPNHLEDPTKYAHCYGSMARLAVYQMALRGNHQALGGFLSHLTKYGTDIQCAALNCVSEAWKGVGNFSGLCYAQYPQIKSKSSTLRTIAFNNLSNYLDNSFSRTSHLEDQQTVQTLLSMLPRCSLYLFVEKALLGKPELLPTRSLFVEQALLGEQELCARIKFGAWLSVAACHPSSDIDMVAFEKKTFRLWSHWLTWGGASSNSYELRLAVVSGLRSFFGNWNMAGYFMSGPIIPSLLALYASLNDDDEDIRTIAADTVSSILKTSLAPPAANEKFVVWLIERYNSSPLFIRDVLYRMTGSTLAARYQSPSQVSYIPAQKQFDLALKEDDSLFAEEEENLYIDEVREIGVWSKLVQAIPPEVFATQIQSNKGLKGSMILEFATWVVDAVHLLAGTMTKDGPLGWTSKPHAYEIVFRVLRCASVLLDYYAEHFEKLSLAIPEEQVELYREVQNVISGLQKVGGEAANKDIHPQLIRELNRRKLLSRVSNKISLKWKNAFPVGRSDIPEDQQLPSTVTPNKPKDAEELILSLL